MKVEEQRTVGAELGADAVKAGTTSAVVGLVARLISCPVLVTDAIHATGAGDGAFVLGGQDVHVRDGEARLASTGSLAGSTLTMSEALRRAVRHSGLTVAEASATAIFGSR